MLDNISFYVKVKVFIWNKLCWESTQALTCDVKAGKLFLSSPTMIVPFLFWYGFLFLCFAAWAALQGVKNASCNYFYCIFQL